MLIQSLTYCAPQLLAGIICTIIAFFLWRGRSSPGAKALMVLMLAAAEWAFLNGPRIVSPHVSSKILLTKLQFFGIVSIPFALLVFVVQYTGREQWLTRRNLVLLGIVPAVTLLLAWTNEVHHLIWKRITLETRTPIPIPVYEYGLWSWIFISFAYLVSLTSAIWLAGKFTHTHRFYRMQIVMGLIGISAPGVINVLYVFKLIPTLRTDPTPIGFIVTGLALGWGMFRFRILDIMPVAEKAVLQCIPDGVFVLDFQNRIVDLNPAAQNMFRLTDSEAVGRPVLDVLGDQPALIERLGRPILPYSEIILGEGNTRHYYDLKVLSLKDGRGRSIGRLLVLRDFTDRKQAEELLRKSEEKYRLLVDNAEDGIFIAQDAIIKFPNPKTERITGYSAEELSKIPFVNLIHPEDRDMVLDRHRRRLNGETPPSSYSFRVKNKTGQLLWVHLNPALIIDWEGKPATLNSLRDITEQKMLEEQLIRTERLAATGQLAASVAHQINSPLQGIAALLSMMKKSSKVDNELLENIVLLEGAFKSISETVKTLLDLNRPDQRNKQHLDVNSVIQDTVILLRDHLRNNNIKLTLDLSPEPLSINGSPQQLGQVFMNLISNATEAIRGQPQINGRKKESPGTGEITIRTGRRKDHYVVEVSDSGPGISKEALRHIFSPFYTEKKRMGLGIGLSICHKIIEDHGGTMEATNSPDSGATFIITLPTD